MARFGIKYCSRLNGVLTFLTSLFVCPSTGHICLALEWNYGETLAISHRHLTDPTEPCLSFEAPDT
jgi:hypothetical protein